MKKNQVRLKGKKLFLKRLFLKNHKKKLLFLFLAFSIEIFPRTKSWFPFRGRVEHAVSQRVVNPVIGSLVVLSIGITLIYWWRSQKIISVLKKHVDGVTVDLKEQLTRIEKRIDRINYF